MKKKTPKQLLTTSPTDAQTVPKQCQPQPTSAHLHPVLLLSKTLCSMEYPLGQLGSLSQSCPLPASCVLPASSLVGQCEKEKRS